MAEVEFEAPYSDAHIAAYPVEYIAGIDLYNAGEFHAAHDAWEERWMKLTGVVKIDARDVLDRISRNVRVEVRRRDVTLIVHSVAHFYPQITQITQINLLESA